MTRLAGLTVISAIACLSSCAVDDVSLGFNSQGEASIRVKIAGKNPPEPLPQEDLENKESLTSEAWTALQKLLGQ